MNLHNSPSVSKTITTEVSELEVDLEFNKDIVEDPIEVSSPLKFERRKTTLASLLLGGSEEFIR
jgi:hypothetical protein